VRGCAVQGHRHGRVVMIRTEAPPKPAAGEPCNGCGVCCLFEPCPLGAVLSRRRRGPCSALQWDAAASRYRCGALAEPGRHLRWLPASWARRLVRRWIAAGTGCDAELEAGPP
jgi:hypothetical protein